jgi:hypothetical protein
MQTHSGIGFVLGRIGQRALAGVWRNRGGVLLLTVLSLAAGAYALVSISSGSAMSPGPSRTDCADTAMLAMTSTQPGAAQRAYECMGPTVRQNVSEADFVRQLEAQRKPSVESIARIGDHPVPSGGMMVYYALDGGGDSVGYIVYLDTQGKVLKIE